jgi:glycosyltransferase involved in cell wall biosynthesis
MVDWRGTTHVPRLAKRAAALGSRVVLEWHEGQDVGEATLPGTRRYVRMLMPRLLSLVDAHVVHSSFDLKAIKASYSLNDAPVHVIPHGPYDHLVDSTLENPASDASPFQLLYFGVVRPFKGVEDLIAAFNSLDPDEASQFRLTVVGENWEGWTAPDRAIEQSRYPHLIRRVDRYVTDRELTEYVGRADGVVLPYHRSSSSGPLHLAMSAGLPVVVTAVGGLVEAVQDYRGALLVPPQDVDALRSALLQLAERRGERYADPHSWRSTVNSYRSLIEMLHREPEANQHAAPQRAAAGAEGR